MRIGIVTDSCCDLPRSFLDEHRIVILPISIRRGDKVLVDTRDPAATQALYRDASDQADTDIESMPFSAEQIRELFLSKLVVDFDYVFCITVMSNRSPIHENAMQASLAILSSYRPIREEAGVTGPFSLRVFDSKTLFPGQGLMVAEVAKMIAAEASTMEIIRRIEVLTETIQAFLMPADLNQLRSQARRKGDKSVGFLSYALGTALDIKPIVRAWRGETGPVAKARGFDAGVEKLFDAAATQIERGLAAKTICVSFGGDPKTVQTLHGFTRLAEATQKHGVDLYLSEMSTTGAVNIGAGGVAIALAANEAVKLD